MGTRVPTSASTTGEIEEYLREEAAAKNGCGRRLAIWLAEVATSEDEAYLDRAARALLEVMESLPSFTRAQSVLFVADYVIDSIHQDHVDRREWLEARTACAADERARRILAALLDEPADLVALAERTGLVLPDVRVLVRKMTRWKLVGFLGSMPDPAESDHVVRILLTLGRDLAVEHLQPA